LKIVLVGDSAVGKSSLLLRFAEGTFADLPATVGVDFRVVTLDNVRGQRVKLTCWDTAGQEKFRTLTSSYYRGANGVILVYSVADLHSFSHIETSWMEEARRYVNNPNVVYMVVGNKADLSPAVVSAAQGKQLAERIGALFTETSAKAGAGITECFFELVLRILETHSEAAALREQGTLEIGARPDHDATTCFC
jgi:Ras-related protein Rab-18